MSRLIFQKDYIIIVPSYDFVESHKHMMQHIFISRKECILEMKEQKVHGHLIILEANVEHKMSMNYQETIFLLLDTTSILATQVKRLFLKEQCYATMLTQKDIGEIPLDKTNDELVIYVEQILAKLGIRREPYQMKDDRIEELLHQIKSGELQCETVSEIAKMMALSPSRLTHLFKQETGVTLKSYLLLNKLERAYKCVLEGQNITEAAMNAGFSDSAHLSAVCRLITGIPLSGVMK